MQFGKKEFPVVKILMMLAFLIPVSLSIPAMAQDEALYDPAAPAGSAFVRFINAGQDEIFQAPTVSGKTYEKVGFHGVSPYYPVKAGKIAAGLGGAMSTEKIESGAFYTVILNGVTLSTIKDEPITDVTKAMILFYNLSTRPNLSLKTEDGKVEIVAATEPGKSGFRAINPVPVKTAVYDGEIKVTDIGEAALKRNESTAMILFQGADQMLKASVVQATTDTTP